MLGRKFYTNVIKIAGATTIAQLIGIATVPIFSRMFSPEIVGQYAIITSIVGILGVFGTGRYELALMLPEEKEKGLNILCGTIIIAFAFSVIILILIAVFKDVLISFGFFKNISKFLFLIPLLLLLNCLLRIFTYWFNREKLFGLNAKLIVFNSITPKLGAIGFGFAGFISITSFIAVYLFVQLFEVGIRIYSFIIKSGKQFFSVISLYSIKNEMVKYIKFPLIDMWNGLLDTGSLLIVPILLSIYFTPNEVGLYSQSLAIVQLPLVLIASAFGQVFFQRLSEDIHAEKISQTVTDAFILLLIAGVPVFTVILLWGREIFSFFLGDRWAIAGVYAELLAPWCCFKLCFSPLSSVFSVMQRQGISLFISIVTIFSRVLSIVIGGMHGDCHMSIVYFSISGVIVNFLGLTLVFYVAKAKLSEIRFSISKLSTLIFSFVR